jgi:dimethylamine/trimethylamine dehydrogenase
MDGARPAGHSVVIYDDDHYYMGGVLAELLVREGFAVTLVTPAADVSNWMRMTMEQHRVQARLLDIGVRIIAHHAVAAVKRDAMEIACIFAGRRTAIETNATVLVTARLPENRLAIELRRRRYEWPDAGLQSLTVIGDAEAYVHNLPRVPSLEAFGRRPRATRPRSQWPASETLHTNRHSSRS